MHFAGPEVRQWMNNVVHNVVVTRFILLENDSPSYLFKCSGVHTLTLLCLFSRGFSPLFLVKSTPSDVFSAPSSHPLWSSRKSPLRYQCISSWPPPVCDRCFRHPWTALFLLLPFLPLFSSHLSSQWQTQHRFSFAGCLELFHWLPFLSCKSLVSPVTDNWETSQFAHSGPLGRNIWSKGRQILA